MITNDPYLWSSDQVRAQLCYPTSDLHTSLQIKPILSLGTLEETLKENDIDGESLLALEDVNVKDDLGISSFGQRREIRKIVHHLRSISSQYQPSVDKGQKRRISSDDEQSQTTSESKKRRMQVPELVTTRPYQAASSSVTPSDPQNPHGVKSQTRRIQPQNLSTEPLTRGGNEIDSRQQGNRILSAITKPEEFNLAELSDEWQDFLRRHQETPDDPILRPYHESDQEMELDSENDASLMEELQSDEPQPAPRLSAQEINASIDETLEEYRTAWNAHKRVKRHKIARQRWFQAAKARTRKPQQNALQRELDNLRQRLDKFRRSIADISMDYHKPSEVKRNCLNLQATVEDIAEREYYLEVLSSDTPPPKPEQTLEPALPEEVLSEGGELLESSDSEQDSALEENDHDHDLSIVSDDDSDVSLSYDPADDNWNPIWSSPVPEKPDQTRQGGISLLSNGEAVHVPEFEDNQPEQLSLERIMPDITTTTIPAPRSPIIQAQLLRTPNKTGSLLPITHMQDDELEMSDGIDSDLDRLPRNRYYGRGGSSNTPIILGSSPIPSDQSTSANDSVRTPPLNPVPTPNVKHERLDPDLNLTFPLVQELRARKWCDVNGDANMALCKVVYRGDRDKARDILQYIDSLQDDAVAERLRDGIGTLQSLIEDDDSDLETTSDPLYMLTYFFVVFAHAKGFPDVRDVPGDRLDKAFEMTFTKAGAFVKLLRPLLKHYIEVAIPKSNVAFKGKVKEVKEVKSVDRDSEHFDNFDHSSKQVRTPIRTKTSSIAPGIVNVDTETESEQEPSTLRKRKRHVEQSQEALSQQRDDQQRVQEQERRRQMMMDKFHSQEASGEHRTVIINSEEGVPVFLDQHIARRIKQHQESGVQFIWRELIEDKKQQGCLLAHTMGLGKTMQVISFLVTLAQCNISDDSNVRNLIPAKLRSGRTLILCPASLVDNWYDEIMMWTPPSSVKNHKRGLLGTIYRLTGTRQSKIQTVKNWKDRSPGVLIAGYESLRSLLISKQLLQDDKTFLEKALLEDPCVVVGDEAHKMKNAKSAISKLAQKFKTNSRIALTGSPLNNHLEEYHTMIDWIAPGYLGSMVQFKAKYSEPIERGLFAESTRFEKRKSLEKLYILKRDLAPKIDRKDISAIASDMPQKTEFFITVPLTELQKKMYSLLIKHILSGLNLESGPKRSTNAQLWSWLSILSWLCNHPTILINKLESREDETAPTTQETEELDEDGAPANVNLAKFPITSLLPRFLEHYADSNIGDDVDNPDISTRALVTRLLIQESMRKGERLLLFSHSIPTLNYLERMLDDLQCKHLRIDGSTRTDQRQAATKVFNDTENDYMVFLISTRAGGLGLNLQGANRVIIYDFGFNPSWEEQAIGRAYRLGQKKPVFVYRFRAGGTFEDAMYNKSIFKTQLFSRVVDQKNVIRQTSRNFKDYLFEPKEAEQKDLSESIGKDELIDGIVQMVPGAIRDLILTETFQREDADDELTADEKKLADEEVDLERLRRTNPQEYAIKLAEKQKAQRAAAMLQGPSQPPSYLPMDVDGCNILHGWFLNPQPSDVVRDVARANAEAMNVKQVEIIDGDSNSASMEESDDQANPPGCEAQ